MRNASSLQQAGMSPSKSTTGIRSSSASVEFDLATVRETRMNTISQMEKKANLLSLPPADGDYISCVLPNGAMYYLRQSNPQGAEKPKDDSNKAQFLSKPMKELLRESEILQSAALLRKADREKRLHSDERVVVASASCGQMWVDKYSPKSFSQLLSSDSTNKEVLKAVKQWDHFVFKRPNPVFHTAPATNTFNNNNSKFKPPQQAAPKPATDSAVDAKEDRGHKEESDSDDDEGKDDANAKTNAAKATKAVVDTRPEYKVILLSGPPGTGKTTLAHIIARHCGYTALEVNASDDSSPLNCTVITRAAVSASNRAVIGTVIAVGDTRIPLRVECKLSVALYEGIDGRIQTEVMQPVHKVVEIVVLVLMSFRRRRLLILQSSRCHHSNNSYIKYVQSASHWSE
jgi:hypothetical protein